MQVTDLRRDVLPHKVRPCCIKHQKLQQPWHQPARLLGPQPQALQVLHTSQASQFIQVSQDRESAAVAYGGAQVRDTQCAVLCYVVLCP